MNNLVSESLLKTEPASNGPVGQGVHGPIIILGAARSGTKLLRSIIAASAQYSEVPYDVNYVWRYGNEGHADDALPAQSASPKIQQFIAQRLSRLAGLPKGNPHYVEKTVSNVLRIPFVLRVLPNARFIFLIRDGRDVAESAYRCWHAKPDIKYLLAKLKTFPWLACASYGKKYFKNALARRLGTTSVLPSWGPRYPAIDLDIIQHQHNILKVCAFQWRACIESYEANKHLIPKSQRLEIKYEDIIHQPEVATTSICRFLNIQRTDLVHRYVAETVTPRSVDLNSTMSAAERMELNSVVSGVLKRWNYDLNTNDYSVGSRAGNELNRSA